MKAIIITQPGGPEVLALADRPMPEPVAAQVRVRVLAAGVNRLDIMQRQGKYPAPPNAPADILGVEFAGVVDALGPEVQDWEIGQRVFGLVGGGAYAEYIITHERLLAPWPETLTSAEAAVVPEAFMTAHDALFTQGDLKMGERVLIHAIGSGVATAALQLANAMGCTTFGTARTPEKLRNAKELGLNMALPLPEFLPELQSVTNGQGVNVIIDFVGKPYLSQNLQALASQGRLVQVGLLGGSDANIDLGVVLQKRLRIIGTMLRSRSLEEKAFVTRKFANQVVPLLSSKKVRPIVDKVFPLKDAAEAHKYMESNANFGKIVLQVTDE
ncbi:MAG: NAD(P)H-quinone oxidoreductase [Abditibacteriaceae bacterium]